MKHHGRSLLNPTKEQCWMMAAGFGFMLAGWYRWPAELRDKVSSLGWKLLLAFMPW